MQDQEVVDEQSPIEEPEKKFTQEDLDKMIGPMRHKHKQKMKEAEAMNEDLKRRLDEIESRLMQNQADTPVQQAQSSAPQEQMVAPQDGMGAQSPVTLQAIEEMLQRMQYKKDEETAKNKILRMAAEDPEFGKAMESAANPTDGGASLRIPDSHYLALFSMGLPDDEVKMLMKSSLTDPATSNGLYRAMDDILMSGNGARLHTLRRNLKHNPRKRDRFDSVPDLRSERQDPEDYDMLSAIKRSVRGR